MARYNRKFLLKLGNEDGPPETFTTISGLRFTGFNLSSEIVDSTDIESGKWQEIQASAGISGIAISGEGVFANSAKEESLRSIAFAGDIKNYQLVFENGDDLQGAFKISRYERVGNIDATELFSIRLVSSGTVTFNKAGA